MIRGGIRATFIIAAVFIGVLAFALFISNSSLAPIGTGKVTSFKVSSESGAGDTGGTDGASGGDAESGGDATGGGTTGSGDSFAPSNQDAIDGPTDADSPLRPGSDGDSDTTTDSGGGGGGGGGRRAARSDDSATEGSGGDGSSGGTETSGASQGDSSRSSVPESFESEEEFVDAFVAVAQTTIAQDYGLKQAEVREVIRNSNQEVSEVVLQGVSEGYFMGLIPVRAPKQLIVSHIDDQAYVRKISIPWWAWLVRFVD